MRLVIGILLAAAAFAAEPITLPLWPGVPPGSETWDWEESVREAEVPPGAEPKTLHFIYNVTRPTLTVYRPEAALATGTGIIVCPGGGFSYLIYDHEGTDVARWLNSIGITAFLLKYRIRRTGDEGAKDPAVTAERRKQIVPLVVEDGRQAMRLVRSRAAEWGVDPKRIGVMGFSAGAYIAVTSALETDPALRANFIAPIYPAPAPEDVQPTADTPPMFTLQADGDNVPRGNTIRLYQAWNKAKVPAEMHIYQHGGHGFSMLKMNAPIDTWTDRFREWLGAIGMLKPAR